MPALDDDVWELYTPGDWTQAHDVAAEHPERLRDLQRLFLLEASKYNVSPSTTAATNGSTPIWPDGPSS
jgi:arylsulfatase